MRKRLLVGLLAGCAMFAIVATAGLAATGSADADWAALESAGLVPFTPGAAADLSSRARLDQDEQRRQKLRTQGLAFYEAHPTDPRRWSIVWSMWNHSPRFITGGPNFDRDGNDVVLDQPAATAWKARLGELVAAQAAATDVPVAVAELFDARSLSEAIIRAIGPVFTNPAAEMPVVDWAPLLSRLTDFDTHYPQSGKTGELLQQFMNYYERANPAKDCAAVWQRFATGPNPATTEIARERLRLFALVLHPLELRFTAADGREVDLAKLRGKVVLVDFWATWCHPCIEELPHILAAYRKYHDRGFEVIGITLENARLASTDTPEQRAAKLAKAKQALLDFTTAHDLPWPQSFDGKFWQNDLFTTYAVRDVPAALLFDQEGRLVNVHARGATLEREVKRLLNLSDSP